MSFPFQKSAFTGGEFSPGMFGRQDLARDKVGAATMRNMWPKFSGGAYSRGGLAMVNFSKQTGRNFPPRLVPFQFNINQGLSLEFGNFYMRVISQGAYVTDQALPISNVNQGNPAIVTIPVNGIASATPINTNVTASYAPGDLLRVLGGTFSTPGVIAVTNTSLKSLALVSPGGGIYAPGNTINLGGGVQSTQSVATVNTTQVVSATIAAAGTGGTPGVAIVTGTTGTGTKFQANVTISSGGVITAVNSITLGGSYTVNPTTPTAEPVTGGGLTGAQLNVKIGVNTFTITNPGVFTTNPTGGALTQSGTSGTGVNANFGSALMQVNAASVNTPGSYSAFPSNPVSVSNNTGSGAGVQFNLTTVGNVTPFNNGDWVVLSGVTGMTQINGLTAVVASATGSSFTLQDIYGNAINTLGFSPYVSGGFASRIFTVSSPYAETDLPWLKWTQSADVMSICCLNQNSNVVYAPYDLTRNSNTSWVFNQAVASPTIGPPAVLNVTQASGLTGTAFYAYAVTAVNPVDGSESLPIINQNLVNAQNILAVPDTNILNWSAVPGAVYYNIYRGTITFGAFQTSAAPFGLIGNVGGSATTFADGGSSPNFNTTLPVFKNPFPTANDYPSVVSYIQGRRIYANSINQPDQYVASQPGAYKNFNVRNPKIDSDAITGAPWSVRVDGIQWMINRPGGLVVLTGDQAWQLTGTGGSSLNPQPLTPANQQAQPQAFSGTNNHVPPVVIGEEIIYVQAKGSTIRDLTYQFYQNIYTGADLTLNSTHLFANGPANVAFNIVEMAWQEEPYKLLWVVRSDGALLSLTFMKVEQIAAWARHDTNGQFVSVCSITEPPVDALYCAVKRQIAGQTAYTIERMNNRIWSSVDDTWCVDAGNSLPQPAPPSTLFISSPTGLGGIVNPVVLNGGTGWSAGTTITVVDNNGLGPGTGAAVAPVIVGGVITGLTGGGGTGYVNPQFYAYDPAGSEGGAGFSATCGLQNTVLLNTDVNTFAPTDVGSVIRAIGGIATITAFNSATSVNAVATVPFSGVVPNAPTTTFGVPPGSWTKTAPVTTVSGLFYLRGATVTGVADGVVIPPQVVSPQGTITLATPASNVVVGLGFTAQVQTLYLEPAVSSTEQGQRKKLGAVTARVEQSRSFQIGSNQVDGSTLSPPQLAPIWNNMDTAPDQVAPSFMSKVVPLWSGDVRIPITGGFNTKGQVALQQTNPLPLNVLSVIPEDWPGDTPQVKEPTRGRANMAQAA